MKEIEKIYDVENQKETIVERNLTAEEISQIEKRKEEIQKRIQENEERQTKREVLLVKLGITEEEAKLLLGGN
jgi:FMN-dependent NADH-azoreductase